MRYIKDKDKAALIVNDGFLKVFRKLETYSFKGNFEGWVRRIVFRSLSDNLRKNANYIKFMVFEDFERAYEDNVLDHLFEEDILKLIDLVPEASGEVFVLYAIQGYSHKEIAQIKGISIGTSKWHLSRARKKLQELILKNRQNHLNAG